jgi:type II secretory pathway component PulF
VIGAATYPVGMLGIFYFILGIFAKKVIPPFERLIPPEQWEGFAGLMHSMVEIFRAAGPAIALAIAALIVLIIVTLPTYWGALEPLRNFLDRHVPPWSIYRMTAGTAFLKTLAAQARASMKIDSILSEMALNSSPWLRTRIDAISEGMAAGKSLGEAMADSGYDFPDRRAVKIMKTLASSEGFETSVSSFAIRWEEATVKKVQAAAKLSIVGSTLAMGLLTGVLFMGIQELTDQVEQQSSEVQSKV